MARLNSTAIERVSPVLANRFTVQFRNGRAYEVFAPRSVRRDLRWSESPGAFYNRTIRPQYAVRELVR